MGALIDDYSKEELEQIVQQSLSMKEVIDKLGYSTHSGSNNNTVKNRIEKYQIDISHFNYQSPQKRNEENVFVENSTANQTTLRRWYKKGNYTPYKCSICGQEPIWQDKELVLILDHINGHNKDDRLENLRWVCPNCNQQLDTTNGKNKKTLEKKKYCIDCGKEISLQAERCVDCANKFRASQNTLPVTREELKQLIRTQTFVSIGQQFNITDNAIKKWCIKYNLPSRKKDISSYSNEEWEKI